MPGAAAAPERLVQQPVGVLVVAAAHEVGLLEVDRIDVAHLDELLDVHHLAPVAGGRLHLVVVEHHVLAGADLVTLDDVVVGHLLVVLRADAAMLDAAAVVDVHLVEVDALRLGGRVELDGHVDHAEGDRPVPDRARHRLSITPREAPVNQIRRGPGPAPRPRRRPGACPRPRSSPLPGSPSRWPPPSGSGRARTARSIPSRPNSPSGVRRAVMPSEWRIRRSPGSRRRWWRTNLRSRSQRPSGRSASVMSCSIVSSARTTSGGGWPQLIQLKDE